MWDIFITKDSIMVNKFISYSLKERNYEYNEGERTVEVLEDVLNQLHAAQNLSKKKRKSLFMLSASKELGTTKSKWMKSFKSFDPLERRKDRSKDKEVKN